MAAPKGNKNAVGNDGGQPPFYKKPADLKKAVDAYFKFILGEGKEVLQDTVVKEGKNTTIKKIKVWKWSRYPEPATITGLALFLGFSDRQSLYDYQSKIEFSCIIKTARTKVEHAYEKSLQSDFTTGAIFALKNMGWNDKHEITTNNVNYNTTLTPSEIKDISTNLNKEY